MDKLSRRRSRCSVVPVPNLEGAIRSYVNNEAGKEPQFQLTKALKPIVAAKYNTAAKASHIVCVEALLKNILSVCPSALPRPTALRQAFLHVSQWNDSSTDNLTWASILGYAVRVQLSHLRRFSYQLTCPEGLLGSIIWLCS